MMIVLVLVLYTDYTNIARGQAMMGAAELAAHILLLLVVKFVGKRRLFLMSSCISVVCVLALTLNAFWIFPSDASSFDSQFVLSSASANADNWLALVLFMLLAFFSGMAAGCPWMFLGEVFPTRYDECLRFVRCSNIFQFKFSVRAAACSMSGAFCYVALFSTTKSYLLLEQSLSIGGALMFYFVVSLIA